jgi:hypothetical protein
VYVSKVAAQYKRLPTNEEESDSEEGAGATIIEAGETAAMESRSILTDTISEDELD